MKYNSDLLRVLPPLALFMIFALLAGLVGVHSDRYIPLIIVATVGCFLPFLIVLRACYVADFRRKALSELAASMGLLFTKKVPESYDLEQTRIRLFSMAFLSGFKASNLMEIRSLGSTPDMSFFDYGGTIVTRSASNITVGLFDFKTPKVPAFELKPKSFIYKTGELIGFKGIDIPSSPLISDKYRLTGPDEIEIKSFFNPGTVTYFEQHLGWHVYSAGRYLVVFKGMRLVKPADYQNFMEEAKNLVSSIVKC